MAPVSPGSMEARMARINSSINKDWLPSEQPTSRINHSNGGICPGAPIPHRLQDPGVNKAIGYEIPKVTLSQTTALPVAVQEYRGRAHHMVLHVTNHLTVFLEIILYILSGLEGAIQKDGVTFKGKKIASLVKLK